MLRLTNVFKTKFPIFNPRFPRYFKALYTFVLYGLEIVCKNVNFVNVWLKASVAFGFYLKPVDLNHKQNKKNILNIYKTTELNR